MRWIYSLKFVAAALLCAPASAQTSAVLTCMESGYSEAEQAVIDRYVSEFSLDNDALAEQLGAAIGARAVDCVGVDGSETTMMFVVQHRFSSLSKTAIEMSRPDVAAVVKRIENDLEPAKRERFMRIFEAMVFGDPQTGGSSQPSQADMTWFSNVVISPPINGTVEQSEFIGAYLAAIFLKRQAEEQLAGQ